MLRHVIRLVGTAIIGASIAFSASSTLAQKNKNSAKSEMKEGGKEVGRAGKSAGSDVAHGHPIKGGKDFGKHMGRSGKDVGKGTKHAVHHVTSRNKNGK